MNDKRTRTPEEEVQRLHDLTNAGVFNEGIPTPPAPPAAEEDDEEGEDLDAVAADLRRVAAQTADLPPLNPIPPAPPVELTLRVQVEVPESQVVDILRAKIPPDRVDDLNDKDIVILVTEWQQARTTDPVLVDLTPYQQRVRQMQQTATPPSLNWPDTGGTHEQV